MSKPQRSRDAIRRASFGRAERLKREAADGRPTKEASSRNRARDTRNPPAPKQARARPERVKERVQAVSRAAAQDRKMTALDSALQRVARARDAAERQRQQRLKEQTRAAFNREGERRRDTTRRAEQERQRQAVQATLKRTDDNRRRYALKQAERKREQMRAAFNREAERRCDVARRREHEHVRQRAAAEIERRHKRQLADQQAEHRRQTLEVRTRHQAETRSLRINENTALERHHHAVKAIDDREARALGDFDVRRASLTGRLAERIPGRRQENDRQRAGIQKGFEAERLTRHRDLEALKERQFNVAQTARLNQAKERLTSMQNHQAERTQLANSQKSERPRLIEGQTRVLERAERDRGREIARKEPEREMVRPAPAFNRA